MMPANIRLTEWEKEKLRTKAIEVNKILVKEGSEPLRDSQLLHGILDATLERVTVRKDGKITIEGLLKD